MSQTGHVHMKNVKSTTSKLLKKIIEHKLGTKSFWFMLPKAVNFERKLASAVFHTNIRAYASLYGLASVTVSPA